MNGFSTLTKRIVSAALVLLVLAVSVYEFHAKGMIGVGLLVCTGGIIEYADLALRPLGISRWVNLLFCIFAIGVLLSFTLGSNVSVAILPIAATLLISACLWSRRESSELSITQQFSAFAIFGLVYAGLMPALALHLLSTPQGVKWFALLLVVVFCGDISAYFGGLSFGGPKLMPNVSPNKTISGALCGALGSTLAGMTFVHFFKMNIPLGPALFVCLAAAALAQSGDLFESLLKRVRNVKDSGYFMPGHGGVLDRLDGVYFAAPVIVWAAGHFRL